MDIESVRNYLEKTSSAALSNDTDSIPSGLFEPIIMSGLKVDLIERGRVLCSMKLPPRLLNVDNSLHGGATAALVDVIGGSAIPTINNMSNTGVSMEINVSYLDAAYVGDEIEIEAKALRVGKAIAVATVEFRNKKTGKIIAQGRHTKYLAASIGIKGQWQMHNTSAHKPVIHLSLSP
ncbi:hypothetical protein L1987_33302 [Smallanthus sonchifolius]|uniref:Uncharacterized protein n=1 Tax=Smallanthus sonchifolius TaxID=185202 RepID=A0ACB9HRC7_9ASTR|nr:hypothetical protein L1987_33302 [Smallanthus sonchifolius]